MIYHVVTKANWKNALQTAGPGGQGFYEAESLAKEGFIHTSKAEQVAGVIERYYKNQSNLFLLHIDETKLTASKFNRPKICGNSSFTEGASSYFNGAVNFVSSIYNRNKLL